MHGTLASFRRHEKLGSAMTLHCHACGVLIARTLFARFPLTNADVLLFKVLVFRVLLRFPGLFRTDWEDSSLWPLPHTSSTTEIVWTVTTNNGREHLRVSGRHWTGLQVHEPTPFRGPG